MELKELVVFCNADVRSEDDIRKAIAKIDRKWPSRTVGGLIHCGGVGMAGKVRFLLAYPHFLFWVRRRNLCLPGLLLWHFQTIKSDGTPFDLDTFRDVIDINLIGSFNVARLISQRIVKDYPPPHSHKNKDSPIVEDDRVSLSLDFPSNPQRLGMLK